MAAKPQPMEDSLGETVLLGLSLGLVYRLRGVVAGFMRMGVWFLPKSGSKAPSTPWMWSAGCFINPG